LPRWRSKSLRIRSGSPPAVTSAISASIRQRIEAKVAWSTHPRGIVVDEVLLVEVLLVVVLARLVVEVEVLVDVLALVGGTEVVTTAVDEVVVDDVVLVDELDGATSHRHAGGVVPQAGSVERNVAPAG
jgi:hypothetical protein